MRVVRLVREQGRENHEQHGTRWRVSALSVAASGERRYARAGDESRCADRRFAGIARAREEVLLREKRDLSQRQVMLTQEFEHRLINSLQLIVSLLSLQSRAATTPEAAGSIAVAARRVGALGRVHRRLHLLDHQDHVEFKPVSAAPVRGSFRPAVRGRFRLHHRGRGRVAEIPTAFAIPLGFIVNELITNSAKYAQGNITVRFEATSPDCLSLIGVGRRAGIADRVRSREMQGTRNEDRIVAGEADRRRTAHPTRR